MGKFKKSILIVIISSLMGGTFGEGSYYVFVYQPKTPNIRYDAHPLVAVTDVFQWGFRGINFHWGQVRQYTFPEVVGGLYKVDEMELRDLRTIPFGRIRLNS